MLRLYVPRGGQYFVPPRGGDCWHALVGETPLHLIGAEVRMLQQGNSAIVPKRKRRPNARSPITEGDSMTAAAAPIETTGVEYRKAITAGVIGNVLEWYDFGVYGYLVPT